MVGQLYKQGTPQDGVHDLLHGHQSRGVHLRVCLRNSGRKGRLALGFGSAAVGMIFGLLLYMFGRPVYLKGIGEAPVATPGQ